MSDVVRVVLPLAFLASVLVACGASASSGTSDQDRHFQECTQIGGSFSYNGSDGSWSCSLPPSPTASPS